MGCWFPCRKPTIHEQRYLDEAEWLVSEVTRVLGRRRGDRIGEATDRDGQYFHYLAMGMFALARLGDLKPQYRAWAFNWRATFIEPL